jgi:hypothetical protein
VRAETSEYPRRVRCVRSGTNVLCSYVIGAYECPPLHKFLVSTARASVHFALQLFWILDAASVHMPGAVRMANLRDSVARVVGLRSALADDASDQQSDLVHPVLNRSASFSVDSQKPKPRLSTAVDRKPKRLGFFVGSALRSLDFRFAKPKPFSRSIDFGFENGLTEAIDLESTANGSSSGSKPTDRLPLLQSAVGKVRVPILVPPLPVATADSAADEDEAAAATATVSRANTITIPVAWHSR